MAVNHKTFSQSLVAKDLNYCNPFYSLKGKTNLFSDSFDFSSYEALTDLNDVKTNNYSNLFLGKKQLNSDWLQVNEKEKTVLNVVTTLSFERNKVDDPENKGLWLYFDKNYTFFDIELDNIPYYLADGRPTGENLYNFYFYLEYISDTECRISHTFGEYTYYLACNAKLLISFVRSYSTDCIWNYNVEGDAIQLFKTVVTYNDKTNTSYTRLYTLAYKGGADNEFTLSLLDQTEPSEYNVLHINEIQNQLEYYINNSWVGYDQSTAITAINTDKSTFTLQSQSLFHHQYNKEDGINFLPLKNNITYLGTYTRGDNLTFSPPTFPDVNYRNYTSIHSGINQEYGNDNIILNYNFNDQVYTIEDGQTFSWKIQTLEENNDVNPLAPYIILNVNDSKFVKNGAFASDVPYLADKVYKYQGQYTLIRDDNYTRLFPNNGTYLCTWLYQKDDTVEPVWLDRYYYPDKISRAMALTSPHFSESFENIIDKNYDVYYIQDAIKKNTYFDKVSDLVFEPGNEYKYSRVSSAQVSEVIEGISQYRIEEVVDKNSDLFYLNDEMTLDGRHYLEIDHKLFNKTNAINFNTDIYLDANKQIGIQLFGTDYTSGFNIQNRKDLAPYHYYATDKVIYMLNDDYTIKHQFDLFYKYHDTINKFILGDLFDDVIVVSNLFLYIFSYDLSLRSKISYADILGINDVVVNGVKGNLFGYPYTNPPAQIQYSGNPRYNMGKNPRVITNIGKPSDNTVKIFYKEPEVAVFYETAIAQMISNGNSLLYKGNLYIPYEQNIFKIIFVPDIEKDNFSEDNVESYPCKIRALEFSEYYYNYVKTSSTGTATEKEPTFENEFIEVENKIKNIYIDNYGNIYGFNFDKMTVSPDGDTVYGLYGWDKYVASGGWYWLYNQSLNRLQARVTSSKFAEFGSDESITWMQMNNEGMLCLVRGFIEMSQERRLEIYDKTKARFYQWPLSDYSDIYCLDSYHYIDPLGVEHNAFVMLGKLNTTGTLYKIEYRCDVQEMEETPLTLPSEKIARFYQMTNSNMLMRYANQNKLYFNLFLPNSYLQNYRESIIWDLNGIQTGWYNINVHINLDTAQFEVKINDIEYDNRNDSLQFLPYVNSNGTIFDTTYYFGILGKKYGTTLHQIIGDAIEDPYACKDSRIENTKIYTKSLSYHEYQAMRLEGKKINTISLTLPCAQRSNIEEIVRYFKYVPPSAISNKVKINVSGTGLTTRGEFELLEKEIRRALVDSKDCLVGVQEIEFI